MNEKAKKASKEFVLSDSSINVYGFRLMTEGCMLEEFQKNPIGFLNHEREEGVLVLWEDLRIDGDKILGTPVINLNHEKGQQCLDDIENGFLNGASVGDIQLQEYYYELDEASGCEVLVASKWWFKECSLVDMPGNRSSFAIDLSDATEKQINLNDLKETLKNNSMKKIQLAITPALVSLLGLADGGASADEKTIEAAIENLSDKAKQADALKTENAALTALKDTAESALKSLQDSTTAEAVNRILEEGLAAKKLTVQLRDKLATQYAGKPTELKDLVDAMPAYQPVSKQLNGGASGELPEDVKGKTWDELAWQRGALENLKDNHNDHFKKLYKEKFGKELA